MREAIGGTWLFGLVITFIVFFASFLAISINYAKAFNVKNNVVDLIAKYEGNNPCARKHIAEYLRDTGYLVAGSCPAKGSIESGTENEFEYIGYDLNGNKVATGSKAYFCVAKDSNTVAVPGYSKIDKYYYRVIIFFRIDLPMFGNLTTYKIKGETESVYFPTEEVNKDVTYCH